MNKPSLPLKKRGLGRGLEALLGSKGGSLSHQRLPRSSYLAKYCVPCRSRNYNLVSISRGER